MRNAQRFRFRTPILVIAIMATICSLWAVGLLTLWALSQTVSIPGEFWPVAQTMTSTVAMLTFVNGGILAYRQLREAARSRHMAVANQLFEELNSPQNIQARRWLFKHLPDDPEQGARALTPEGQAAVKTVLNSLDHVAFLTQAGWIPDEVVMPWMNPMIVKAWAKLERYVEHESRRRREPDYYRYVRDLAQRCRAWRDTHLPDSAITWLDDAL